MMGANVLLDKINREMLERIREHAKAEGITFDEAVRRARIVVNGVEIKPLDETSLPVRCGWDDADQT